MSRQSWAVYYPCYILLNNTKETHWWLVSQLFFASFFPLQFRPKLGRMSKVNKSVRCETCGISLNSEQQAQQHYSGKNHLKKLKQAQGEKTGKTGKNGHCVGIYRPFNYWRVIILRPLLSGKTSPTPYHFISFTHSFIFYPWSLIKRARNKRYRLRLVQWRKTFQADRGIHLANVSLSPRGVCPSA